MSKTSNSDYQSPSFDGDSDYYKRNPSAQEFGNEENVHTARDVHTSRDVQQAPQMSYEYPRNSGDPSDSIARNQGGQVQGGQPQSGQAGQAGQGSQHGQSGQAQGSKTNGKKRSFGGFGRKNNSKDAIDIDEVAEKHSRKYENESFMERFKRISSVVLTVAVLFLAIWGLVDLVDWVMDLGATQETPENAVRYMLELVEDDNYEAFAQLVNTVEGSENAEALFNELQVAITTADGQLLTDFVRIRLENGKEFLVSAYYDEDTEQYELRSIIEISREYQEFFAR